MASGEIMSNRLHSASWIIDARWYYASLAFFLGMIAENSGNAEQVHQRHLVFMLIIAIVLNIAFFFAVRNSRSSGVIDRHVFLLNVAQVGFDLIYFFIIILISGGGLESIAHSFYFIPIIVSMILFGFRGAIIVAACSGVLVFLSVFIQYGMIFPGVSANAAASSQYPLNLALVKASILFLIYLLTGFFGAYISRIIKIRDTLLLEKINEGAQQVSRLEELTKEFDQSAKLLVRRDLDLSLANQQLMKLDQLKSEIISVAAHQLRTPLSAIKWTLKMLIDGDIGELTTDQKTLLGKGFESNERMINLVNDMLSVDRLESGKIKYNFVPVQFDHLVDSIIQELLPIATKKGVRLELIRPSEELPKIKMDPDKIHDVVQNLLDNAIKYSKEGGTITASIIVKDGETVEFIVQDSGIGIPQNQQEKIFSRFFRANNAVRTETDGSGLGLFIAFSIAKRHGGNIWFESTEGQGSTFHFTLPMNS